MLVFAAEPVPETAEDVHVTKNHHEGSEHLDVSQSSPFSLHSVVTLAQPLEAQLVAQEAWLTENKSLTKFT